MSARTRARTRTRTVAVAVLAALALVACGDDGDDAAVPGTDSPAVVEVTATDFGFAGVPARVAAGTRFTLTNDAPTELHELVAFRLPDDEDRPMSELAGLPPEELMPLLGVEPATVLLAPPGGDQIAAVGDGTLSEPGRYAVICMIPTGVEPAVYLEAAATSGGGPPQVDGGPPHLAHGMWAELVVG